MDTVVSDPDTAPPPTTLRVEDVFAQMLKVLLTQSLVVSPCGDCLG